MCFITKVCFKCMANNKTVIWWERSINQIQVQALRVGKFNVKAPWGGILIAAQVGQCSISLNVYSIVHYY